MQSREQFRQTPAKPAHTAGRFRDFFSRINDRAVLVPAGFAVACTVIALTVPPKLRANLIKLHQTVTVRDFVYSHNTLSACDTRNAFSLTVLNQPLAVITPEDTTALTRFQEALKTAGIKFENKGRISQAQQSGVKDVKAVSISNDEKFVFFDPAKNLSANIMLAFSEALLFVVASLYVSSARRLYKTNKKIEQPVPSR